MTHRERQTITETTRLSCTAYVTTLQRSAPIRAPITKAAMNPTRNSRKAENSAKYPLKYT